MTFGSGELNICAELQQKAETRTDAGGRNPGWVFERDVWVKIRPLSPRLKLEAMAREPQITHEIVARQEDDIDATKRLVVGTRTFMIEGIPADVDERGAFIQMMAVEGVAT